MPRTVPNFDDMWDAYPHGSSTQVKSDIGGAVDNPLYENTCAIRMSVVLNAVNDPIPAGRPGLYTVKGGDNKWYALRSRELPLKYYQANDVYGPPTLYVLEPTIDELFAGRRGLVSFIGIPGYLGGYGGHVDLWNGATAANGHYFNSKFVRLWEPEPLTGDDLARCTKSVNLRLGPGTQHDKKGKLGVGSLVRILDRDDKWARVSARLWVHRKYIKELAPPPPPEPTPVEPVAEPSEPLPPPAPGGLRSAMVTAMRLNVRRGPGPSHAAIKKLSQGEIVTIYAEENGWVKVEQQPEGWVSGRYVDDRQMATSR